MVAKLVVEKVYQSYEIYTFVLFFGINQKYWALCIYRKICDLKHSMNLYKILIGFNQGQDTSILTNSSKLEFSHKSPPPPSHPLSFSQRTKQVLGKKNIKIILLIG